MSHVRPEHLEQSPASERQVPGWDAFNARCGVTGADASHLLSRGLLSSSNDCVKVLSLEGEVLFINAGGYQILEVDDPARVDNVLWLDFWTGPYRALAERAVREAREGSVARFQGYCPTFAGSPRWWDVVVSPMMDSSGSICQLLSVSRDITEMRRAQLSIEGERAVLEKLASGSPLEVVLERLGQLVEQESEGGQVIVLVHESGTRFTCRTPPFPGFAVDLEPEAASMARWADAAWDALRHELTGVGLAMLDVVPIGGAKGQAATGAALYCVPAGCRPASEWRSSWTDLLGLTLQRHFRERALLESERRYESLSRVSPVGIFHASSDGGWSWIGGRWAAISGLDAAGSLGDGWLEAVHPEDRDRLWESWRSAVAQGAGFRAEFRLLRRDDHVAWVMCEAMLADADGYIGTVTDITAIKGAQKELAETAARFELLANNMSQLCWIADSKGWIFWYNKRWFDYTGTTLEQMQGWGWRQVHHPDHVDRVVERISYCWQTGDDWEDTFPLRSKSGEYRWFLSRAMPIRDGGGQVQCWFGTNTDITEQLRLEESLARQNVLLSASNAELQRFAYVAGHDLQAPLRSICVNAQILERSHGSELSPEGRKHVDTVVSVSKRMSGLITDLLEYSALNSGPVDLDASCAVRPVLDEVLQNLAEPIESSGAAIRIASEVDGCTVRAAHVHMVQLLQNLIGNSIKYRRTGEGPVIGVEARREGASWRIRVADNGIGFDPEDSDRIFSIFQRLPSHDVPGSGLGLAICRSIVERAGGSISAEGRPGEGATFTLSLPAA